MDDRTVIRPIAYIHTDFHERFGIPRQAGLAEELTASIVFTEEFRDRNAVKGLIGSKGHDGFDYIWLIWGFSETRIDMDTETVSWSPTVTPPRLGGKVRMGVFATRSPYRPNSLGLSSVKLLSVDLGCAEAPVLIVGGADLLDGTPIYDIKPYVPYTDSHPDASGGFAVSTKCSLHVDFPDNLLQQIPLQKRAALLSVLQQDPRGSYEKQPGYIYGLHFAEFDIRFTADDRELKVIEVCQRDSGDASGFQKVK